MSDANDERLRQLERDHAATAARIAGVEGQQREFWTELRRVSKEGREQYASLQDRQQEDTERLLLAINANKIAWSMMSGGTKAAAWVIGVLIGLGGLAVAVWRAFKHLFSPAG